MRSLERETVVEGDMLLGGLLRYWPPHHVSWTHVEYEAEANADQGRLCEKCSSAVKKIKNFEEFEAFKDVAAARAGTS